MKLVSSLITVIAITLASTFIVNHAFAENKILFIGNSFTFGAGSAVKYYRADSVTDLNEGGIGGVPALFKSFTKQAKLDYKVYVETRGGSALDFHLREKREIIGAHKWDQVVMHGYSTLDAKKPGDPAMLIETAGKMATYLKELNPEVDVYLTSTWSRADIIYQHKSLWSGTPIAKMALDVRAAYNKAHAASSAIKGVNGVGEAWTMAMELGIADINPYNGIEYGKVSLWSWDHYHASTYGYYLHALVVFGNLTGIDPRSLGENECSAYELGMSRYEVKMLQQAAYNQLASEQKVKASAIKARPKNRPTNCF